jgi:hypothetical protein
MCVGNLLEVREFFLFVGKIVLAMEIFYAEHGNFHPKHGNLLP